MTMDDYDTILLQRGAAEAFQVAADDARRRLGYMGDFETENHRLLERVEELERRLAEHRYRLPADIDEALNSGDGSYHP